MTTDAPKRSERDQREIDFFASYYAEQAYNPVGSKLKLKRDLRALLAATGRRLGRVLSIGCGDGEFERMLAPHADRVTALDISPEAIEIARHHAKRAGLSNLEFRCLGVNELEWSERFDTITCVAFLHHVPEAELPDLLRRVHEQLAPGGVFYSQDPNVNGVMRKIGRVVMGSHYDDYHSADERELDPDELRAQLSEAGFAIVEIVPIDLTLLPAMYILAKRPSWPLHVCALVDRAWCATPLGRWASGFAALSRRAA